MTIQATAIARKVRLIIAGYFGAFQLKETDNPTLRKLGSSRHDLGNLITVVQIQTGVMVDPSVLPDGEGTTINQFVDEVEKATDWRAAA